VEGANILTRTLMIFGQGAIRCHPYVYQEIAALNAWDVPAFDRALWHHLGAMIRNGFRATLLSVTRGALAASPVNGPPARYYRQLAWASATFAFLTDLALFSLGGSLKRREKLTGRFADILSWMYLGTATLRRFEAEGTQPQDLPLLHWAMQYTFAQIQRAFEGLLANLPVPVLGAVLRGPLLSWWRLNPMGSPPSDQLGSQVARLVQTPGAQRDRLTAGIYIPTETSESLGRLEQALQLSVQADPVLQTLKAAIRSGQLPKAPPHQLIPPALAMGIITEAEAALLQTAESARNNAIQVDSFTLAEYLNQGGWQPSNVEQGQPPKLAVSSTPSPR